LEDGRKGSGVEQSRRLLWLGQLFGHRQNVDVCRAAPSKPRELKRCSTDDDDCDAVACFLKQFADCRQVAFDLWKGMFSHGRLDGPGNGAMLNRL
jgi:hypothetical protein